jgi:cyclase
LLNWRRDKLIAKRIIPCLDCGLAAKEGRVVKGVRFNDIAFAGNPTKLAEKYYLDGADEIAFLDITATIEKRQSMVEVIAETTKNVFVPLTVGGGINSVEAALQLFNAGADKIAVNSAAVKNPMLVSELAEKFGSQAVVAAIDAKRIGKEYFVFTEGGRKQTGLNAIGWIEKVQELGAGEILLTSIDNDGTKKGFELELLKQANAVAKVPIIASGGAGTKKDFFDALSVGKADAVLAASLFHFRELTVCELKDYLKEKGVIVR